MAQLTDSTLTLIKPDDWHLHLRDDVLLSETVPATARQFSRAIVMPNLTPPVINAEQASAYAKRIVAHIPEGQSFTPLMTLYLTEQTTAQMIRDAHAGGWVKACKLYPAGATTNSANGVKDLSTIYPALAEMERLGVPLLVHGEVTDHDIDIFDREAVFIERHLQPLVEQFTQLKVVFEHITTQDAVAFVKSAGECVAATITPQHLLLNRNDLLVGGIRPHNYCLPVLKRNIHQQALRAVVASGDRRFFLGTDSAPHLQHRKESACGCAGCYSARAALELYAEVFTQLDALPLLEGFASCYGPDFYGLPRNTEQVTLKRQPWQIPDSVTIDGEPMVPFMAGHTMQWQLQNKTAAAGA